ncbi:MAG: chemotaxis protein CheW [Lachnospiraceae bacterium]|nr:chemotaxis protein CheW [Lachnospiraceae bacterium]
MQEKTITYLKLYLGQICFAVPAANVAEIVTEPVTSPVPSASPGLCGILYHDRSMVPLVALAEDTKGAGTAVICGAGEEKTAYLFARADGFFPVTARMLEEGVTEKYGGDTVYFPDKCQGHLFGSDRSKTQMQGHADTKEDEGID